LKFKKPALVVSIIHLLFFIPFLSKGYISSDWDSYAIIGSAKIYIQEGIYIPSRPPGFPLSELLSILAIRFSELIPLEFEKILLIIQFIFLMLSNILIFKLLSLKNRNCQTLYFLIMFSPIYIISGLTVIDYIPGLFFGFLGILLILNTKKYKNMYVISLLFAFSIGFRLSNIIFLFALIFYLILIKKDQKSSFIVVTATGVFSLIIYGIAYWSLWSNTLSTIYSSNISEVLCIFNLTNTDHDPISRLGRFVLKQASYLSVLGSLLFLANIKKIKNIQFFENIIFMVIFILFQISFLRLPTEEGHMLPAFIAAIIIISNSKVDLSFGKILFVIVLLSNFINLNFYDVNETDSATEIYFNSEIKPGLLVEDYNLRIERGQNKQFHYQNSIDTLNKAWKNGCPN